MIGFEDYGMKRTSEIVSLRDERLAFIDTSVDGFFDKVLDQYQYYKQWNTLRIGRFQYAVREMQNEGIEPFYRPIFDPSFEKGYKKTKVVFKKGGKPAVGYSFNNWKQIVESMQAVEGKTWKIGTEYQYYAFLVDLVNKLVDSGWKINSAMEAIIIDSLALGHYKFNSSCKRINMAEPYFEDTGSREICGYFDLANTFKLLSFTNHDIDGYWRASGSSDSSYTDYTLANLDACNTVNGVFDFDFLLSDTVAWLVLQ